MILIVDDTPENLFSLKTLLQINGFEVDTAASGEEALRKILKNHYALIILDVQMPDMDGYEVAEAITGYSRSKDIPIIFLSAVNIDKRFIAKGYESGGVDYVTKPFDPELLLLKIKTFYKLYLQTRQLNETKAILQHEVEVRLAAEKKLQESNALLEHKVAERTNELTKTNKELQASNKELQQYAFLASHDLQEPMRKILVFSRLVQDRYLNNNPEALQYTQRIISASERMRNLIDDLLQYSKLSSEKFFITSDLNQLLKETLTDLELLIEEKGATITAGKLPVADVVPGQIRQLFQNIISNAIKFARKGVPPKIVIASELVAEKSADASAVPNGIFIRLRFTDNGIGFNEDYLEKIFSIFQRLNAREEYEGTGIGLAIVKKIVDQHNGIITATSQEGEGSSFIIVLPRFQEAVAASEPSFQ